MLLATIVDREGRSVIVAGGKEECEKAAAVMRSRTARVTRGPATPLGVDVLPTVLVAHQHAATRLLAWLVAQAQTFSECNLFLWFYIQLPTTH